MPFVVSIGGTAAINLAHVTRATQTRAAVGRDGSERWITMLWHHDERLGECHEDPYDIAELTAPVVPASGQVAILVRVGTEGDTRPAESDLAVTERAILA